MTSKIQLNPPTGPKAMIRTRLQWLDTLRGLFMVLMAVDHANYFVGKVHMGEFWGISLPQYHSAIPFLTRFVTHFCAPGFFFIMGISMILFADSRYRIGWSRLKVFRHYALRGAILIGLQLFLENPAWMIGGIGNAVQMSPPPGGGGEVWFHFGVLSALGGAMILCGLALRFQPLILVLMSLGAVAITAVVIPLLDANALYSPLLRLVIIPGQTNSVQVFYPLFPWVGLTGFGMAFGKTLLHNNNRLSKLSLMFGLALVIAFAVLRMAGLGSFHSPASSHWTAFLNVTKYPPSLTFITITMGVNLCVVSFFTRIGSSIKPSIDYPLRVFGMTALFFYIVHLYLYAFIGLIFPHGASITVIYTVWIIGLFVLFPVCKRYNDFKQNTAPNSLWRFF